MGIVDSDCWPHSAWFVESTLTELTVMLVLRTNRSFYRSRVGPLLWWSSLVVAIVVIALPYSPVAGLLGLTMIPTSLMIAMIVLICIYAAVNELAKRWIPPHSAATSSTTRHKSCGPDTSTHRY